MHVGDLRFARDYSGNLFEDSKAMVPSFPERYSVFERSMPSDLIRGWRPVRVKKTR